MNDEGAVGPVVIAGGHGREVRVAFGPYEDGADAGPDLAALRKVTPGTWTVVNLHSGGFAAASAKTQPEE